MVGGAVVCGIMGIQFNHEMNRWVDQRFQRLKASGSKRNPCPVPFVPQASDNTSVPCTSVMSRLKSKPGQTLYRYPFLIESRLLHAKALETDRGQPKRLLALETPLEVSSGAIHWDPLGLGGFCSDLQTDVLNGPRHGP